MKFEQLQCAWNNNDCFGIFQGVLLALRTYIFVDTTDRMDLTLAVE